MKCSYINRILLFGLLAICLNSCKHKTERYFVCVRDTSCCEDSRSQDEDILVRTDFYAQYNILLIDSMHDIYYHKERFYCLTGTKWENKYPIYRNLRPEYFLRIENMRVMADSVLSDTICPEWIYIASNKDTIRDRRFFILRNIFENCGIHVVARKITEEENAVMEAVLNNKEYRPDKVNWTETESVPPIELLEKRNSTIELELDTSSF